MLTIQNLLREINNALLDLQGSDLQSYERPLKTLGRLLRNVELERVNERLSKDVDLEEFLRVGEKTGGGFVGSRRLIWPENKRQELGLTLLLIDKFAEDPRTIINFGHTYYHAGSKLIANVQAVVRQLLIPFVRDYKEYAIESLQEAQMKSAILGATEGPNKVFVVHGHDGEAREAVARFIERLGYKPIILHEQANRGRTVIEKVEANSDVGFAVVLLTPADQGCAKGEALEPRARQNVLLELGYFIGLLGRDKVCALKKGDVVIPSDFAGVVWESMDSPGWKQALGRELNEAGYEVDWNKVMA